MIANLCAKLTLLPALIGIAVFATLWFFWLAWVRLGNWFPAVATARGSDNGDCEEAEDPAWFGLACNWHWTDSDGFRRTEMEVSYHEETGEAHEATVVRYVRRGSVYNEAFPIWARKDDPDRASPTGPFPFLLFGLLIGAALTTVVASRFLTSRL